MFRKKMIFMVSSFLVLLICFSFIPIYASNNPISKDSNEKLDSSDSACYLDFEDFLSSEDNFICNAYYYYDDIPIISSSGNIEYEILDETHSWARIRIYLAKGEGRLCLLLSSKTMSNSLYIYSSEGMDGKYGVSSYSMDNAKRLVHNLDNQEYMDNDEIPATYVPMPDNSKREEKNRNYTGSGRVYGQLKWTDDNNVVHPLVGIKVKLTFQDSYNSVYQYTDNNGNYDITFGNIVGYTNFECVLHIYTVNNYVVVKDNIGNIYEYVQVLPMSNNSTYQYNHTFDSFTEAYDQQGHLLHQPTFLLGGIQIYEAMYYYSNYAVSLANDTNIPKCYVHYPTARHPSTHNQLDYCFYNNDDNIYLCSESFRNIEKHDCYNGLGGHYPYVEGSWDVIGHEYGHHIQKCYFFQEAGGNHSFGSNCIYKWMFDHCSSSITDKDLYNAKKEGCWLGFGEAWATFFAISAQQTFDSNIKDNIPTIGDYYYQSYDGSSIDLCSIKNPNSMNNQMKCNGESDELIITFFLYRIWESDNYASWDNVSIDDERLWNVMLKNPADFSEFIQYLVNDTSINVSIVDLGKILKVLHLSTFGINISLVGSNHQLTFNRGNSNIKYLSTDYQFNNNEFYIEFYDDNDNMIIGDYIYLAQNSISDEYTYVISNSGWNRILDIQTLGYYVKITAYSNRFYTENGVTISARTGPYITYERFIKPTNYNITLTNSRYYEKTETIPAGGSFVFNVTDNLGGYRLFQTFGYLDSIIYLYDSLGNPLATNDNFGFSNNGLIYYNISANTTYIINVINNSQVNGLIKLTIIPCTGDLVNNSSTIESVSDIYYHNSNNTYSTYVPQNESIVIRWKPAITGYYCLVLMSNFDSYLYVIDPDSPNLLIEDEDFNDNFVYDEDHDLYDEDSALYGHYYSDQTYLIVISKYNLQDVGSNISIRFDFFFAG